MNTNSQVIVAHILRASGEINEARGCIDTAIACALGNVAAKGSIDAAITRLQYALNNLEAASKEAS